MNRRRRRKPKQRPVVIDNFTMDITMDITQKYGLLLNPSDLVNPQIAADIQSRIDRQFLFGEEIR